jgi:hypothetical protein
MTVPVGEPEPHLSVAADEVEPCEPAIDLGTGEVHAVVVIYHSSVAAGWSIS